MDPCHQFVEIFSTACSVVILKLLIINAMWWDYTGFVGGSDLLKFSVINVCVKSIGYGKERMWQDCRIGDVFGTSDM